MDKKGIIEKKSKNVAKGEILIGILIPVILLIVLLHNIIAFRIIPTASMSGTIETGDLTMTNMCFYKNRDISRYDVVLANRGKEIVQKRVIGMPGDEITFSDGLVYVNGVALDEPYLQKGVKTECNKSFQVPKNSYFLLGDNRTNSSDSREWDSPYVKKEDILGRTYAALGCNDGIHIRLL